MQPNAVVVSLMVGLVVVNVWAVLRMGFDKHRAKKDGQRVSEWALVAPVVFGGLPGVVAGMLLFRHKTSKRSFHLKLLVALLGCAGLVWAAWSLWPTV